MEEEKKGNSPGHPYRSFGLFSIIVADLAGYTGAGIGLGYLLWKKLGWPWWVIIITTNAGLALAMFRIYKLSLQVGDSDGDKK